MLNRHAFVVTDSQNQLVSKVDLSDAFELVVKSIQDELLFFIQVQLGYIVAAGDLKDDFECLGLPSQENLFAVADFYCSILDISFFTVRINVDSEVKVKDPKLATHHLYVSNSQ